MNENICAISTSLGVGAISIIRASGPDVFNIDSIIPKPVPLNKETEEMAYLENELYDFKEGKGSR